MTPIPPRINFARLQIGFLLAVVILVRGLGAGESEPDKAERPAIIVLGDSLAAGSGVDPSEAFPALLQRLIDTNKLPHRVVNAGVSGDTTAGGLRRVEWVLRGRVEVLLLELGGNDGLRGVPLTATRTNLQGIIDKTRARYPEVKVVIAGMQMPPNLGEDYTSQFRGLFPELARTNRATLIPFLLEGVAGSAELNLPDQIHPTPAGHAVIATNVWRVLEKVLKPDGGGSGRPARE